MSTLKKTKKATVTISPKIMDFHETLWNDVEEGSKTDGQCYTTAFLADKNVVSTSTVNNHFRQFFREGRSVLRSPRGWILSKHASLADRSKTQLKLTKKQMGVVIEANAVCPDAIKAFGASKHKDRVVIIDIAKKLMGDGNGWTTSAHEMWNIVDEDDERKRSCL
jgi:hypothetical protein